ncbi:MAG: hypothetical protein HC769_24205 [Cyanobacteria bacterium CRU_2_1]|nr:hypothetical protein [Cyanobacteria bacterium RU_5_0]NJR61663.1 hypothetical protein [Cyanobacteria bacterium CRU_2_1]
MQSDLEDLKIAPSQLEKLTGLEISDTFMGRAYRPSVFRDTKRLLSFLVTESLTFGLILIICLPAGLVIGRGFGSLTGDAKSTFQFLFVTISISIAIFVIWNIYMWVQTKTFKTLAHLLDEVDKHNEIVEAVHVIDELGAIHNSMVQVIDREEVLKALSATRESLINALMTEKLLRKHKKFIVRRHELFTNIETNLATLQTLQVDNQANEYGQLLNEALQIGMSIREEIDQLDQK